MRKSALTLALLGALIMRLAGGTAAAQPPASDYSDPGNWMSAPQNGGKSIDVFFLYPSAWRPAPGNTQLYADIDDAQMRGTAEGMLEETRGMFDHVANIYAPFYRQTDPEATLKQPMATVEGLIAGQEPAVDALAAFEYYLENYNQGRPFILVSHSQGSSTMKVSILEEMIAKRPDLRSRMIAAYTIGWTYTRDYLGKTGLKFAQRPDDTGVIIAWNTEAPGVTDPNPVVFPPGVLLINPINWTTTDRYAPASESLGSNIPGYSGSDGQIDPGRGVVINTTIDPADYDLSPTFPYGSLHMVEWELYYYDVFQNVVTRSLSYYTPKYAAYAAELGGGRPADFAAYLRSLLDRNPNPGRVFFHPVHSIFFRLAGQPYAGAFKAELDRVYSSLTPQASGQALASLGGLDRAVAGLFRKQLLTSPAPGQVSASADQPGWSLWARPFYTNGTQEGDSRHSEIDVDYMGFSMGAVKRTGTVAYGLGFQAGRGDFDSSLYDAEARGLGLGLGITRRFRISGGFAPELSLTGGYSSYSFEQRRKIPGDLDPAAGVYKSDPRVALWNLGLAAGNEFYVREGVGLRPEIAFDYVSTKMKPYGESGDALALKVEPERYESFRSSAGLVLNWEVLENLRFSAGGHWHHEFADNNVTLSGSIRNLPTAAFSEKGRDLGRDSGTAGLGLEWSLAAPLDMSVALDYAHSFGRSYTGNEVNARFTVRF